MAYTISKNSKSLERRMDEELRNAFDSPVKYDFPSPPKTKPKSVKKIYVSTIDTITIDTIFINKIAKKLGLNQLSRGQIKQLKKYVHDQSVLNKIEQGVALDYLLKNIKSTSSLTSAIIDTKLQLRNLISNLKSNLRKGRGNKTRRRTRNKKIMKVKKKSYRRKRR